VIFRFCRTSNRVINTMLGAFFIPSLILMTHNFLYDFCYLIIFMFVCTAYRVQPMLLLSFLQGTILNLSDILNFIIITIGTNSYVPVYLVLCNTACTSLSLLVCINYPYMATYIYYLLSINLFDNLLRHYFYKDQRIIYCDVRYCT
jgi:hypothetical protein